MKYRSLLLLIAVILVGLFALPNAISVFAGQHSFDKNGSGSICQKCHSDVYSELTSASTYHTSIITSGNPCKACHSAGYISGSLLPLGNGTNGTGTGNVGLNITTGVWSNGTGNNISFGAVHAAVTVECVSCHYGTNLTNPNEAHNTFYLNASDAANNWLKGGNEACVGCHTKVYVNMTWVRKGGYNYAYDFLNKTGIFGYNNTNVNTTTNNTG